ncbi:MAG: glycoside hydrolase family 2 protein [Candidatus Dormibacteraceae bacterium]
MQRVEISNGWTLTLEGDLCPPHLPRLIPAEVPGTVHTDLLAAGLIQDPFTDRNEDELRWIGRAGAIYDVDFDLPRGADERVDLVFDGLDTIATIELNGSRLGKTRNQHRSYRFDVRRLLRSPTNHLRVAFEPALTYAVEAQRRLGEMPSVGNPYPYNAIRKMASNFGWDWGPPLITAGIWRPAAVERWSRGRIDSLLPRAHADGTITIEVRVERAKAGAEALEARVTLTDPNGRTVLIASTPVLGQVARVEAKLDAPELWWPRGYGEQPLYQLSIDLEADGVVVDRRDKLIGFRDIAIKTPHDHGGVGFEFHVNDRFVYIKGANWIPDDCFLTRMTRERYCAAIADAFDAGVNLLRVWGGGIFESDPFYDECDRRGVLVWQDFLFACAAYSEAEEIATEVEAEARENVARLMSHPCLAVWNGSNETVEGYFHWGWEEKLGGDAAWGDGYYRGLLPDVLAELDPDRPYLPSSPFNPVEYSDPRNPNYGTVHNWEVWNRRDYTEYRNSIPRFVAEFGFQGPPTASTIAHAIHDDPISPRSPAMRSHQKANDGEAKLERGFARHLPPPQTFGDWLFTTHLNQARAIRFAIEHFRSHRPRTAGSILWQLNDCWPGVTWSAVDGEGRRKPLWFALRDVNADHLITIQPREEGLAVVISNEGIERWSTDLTVARFGFDGVILARMPVSRFDLDPHTASTVYLEPTVSHTGDPAAEVITAVADGASRAFWYFSEDLGLALPPFRADISVTHNLDGYCVRIMARAFLKDVGLAVDRVDPDAGVDDVFATLFPGEAKTFTVTTKREIGPTTLARHPVLNSVNQLLHVPSVTAVKVARRFD